MSGDKVTHWRPSLSQRSSFLQLHRLERVRIAEKSHATSTAAELERAVSLKGHGEGVARTHRGRERCPSVPRQDEVRRCEPGLVDVLRGIEGERAREPVGA